MLTLFRINNEKIRERALKIGGKTTNLEQIDSLYMKLNLLINNKVKNFFSVCSIDAVGKPLKQLGAEA